MCNLMKLMLKIKKVSIVDRGIFYEQLHYTLLVFCVNKKATHNRVTFDNPYNISTTNSFGLYGSLGGFPPQEASTE